MTDRDDKHYIYKVEVYKTIVCVKVSYNVCICIKHATVSKFVLYIKLKRVSTM